ncbi:hemerythrin domain-containing protein [Streptomyces sp900129855]|uniref:Hemerythrin domain-containing protein n=1 Tax=Streptomyces sp. 900129855 TaxID=3155129 RepID=A0ABV2ZH38_9ACTN
MSAPRPKAASGSRAPAVGASTAPPAPPRKGERIQSRGTKDQEERRTGRRPACEYWGCQSLASIDELTREHDEVVRLISHLRPAHQEGGAARMAEVAREIVAVLGPHTQVEEHGLFPALAGDFPDQSGEQEAEHRACDESLCSLPAGVGQEDSGAQGERFCRMRRSTGLRLRPVRRGVPSIPRWCRWDRSA